MSGVTLTVMWNKDYFEQRYKTIKGIMSQSVPTMADEYNSLVIVLNDSVDGYNNNPRPKLDQVQTKQIVLDFIRIRNNYDMTQEHYDFVNSVISDYSSMLKVGLNYYELAYGKPYDTLNL